MVTTATKYALKALQIAIGIALIGASAAAVAAVVSSKPEEKDSLQEDSEVEDISLDEENQTVV